MFSSTDLKQRWSLYLTDSVDVGDDGFVCCPGSHEWPDADEWESGVGGETPSETRRPVSSASRRGRHRRVYRLRALERGEKQTLFHGVLPRQERPYGLTRTTHWANTGDVSIFNYGGERNAIPQGRFDSVSRKWKGHGAIFPAPERFRKTHVRGLARAVSAEAGRVTTDDATALLDPAISRWL